MSSFFRFDTSPVDGDYRVIDVDYDRYAVVYSCTQLLFLKYELGWILTRDPMVNQSLVSEIVFCNATNTTLTQLVLQIDTGLEAFERNGISPTLTTVEHTTSCTYDPSTRCIDSANGL